MNAKVKLLWMAGMVSLMLASCSKEESRSGYTSDDAITFNTRISRATETTLGTLKDIRVYADAMDYPMFIDGLKASKAEGSNSFEFATPQYWPSGINKVRFWAYGPYDIKITPNITADGQSFGAYTPKSGTGNPGKDHEDLIVAYTEAQRDASTGSNVELNFHHAMSQVVVNAKSGSTDGSREVTVAGAWIVNAKPTGTLSFNSEAANNNYMKWDLSGDKTFYGLELSKATKLTSTNSNLIGGSDNSSLMLIPQKLDKWDLVNDKPNAENGAYILVLCRVELKHKGETHPNADSDTSADDGPIHSEGGYHYHQIFPVSDKFDRTAYGYTCVPINTEWLPNKKYIYNLEFCGSKSGAGVYPPTLPDGLPDAVDKPKDKETGDNVLDQPIKFTVTVGDWTSAEQNENIGMQ